MHTAEPAFLGCLAKLSSTERADELLPHLKNAY